MRLLVLGGTVFLGRAVARQALAAGHEVVCAARGRSGLPVEGVRLVAVDRDDPDGLSPLAAEGHFDAVVDVARRPSHVRRAVAALADRVDFAVFVSSCAAYADQSTPGQRADSALTLPPAPPEADPDGASYGPCKVACELAVRNGFGAQRSFICRAGLIVGPEDRTDRFGYWVRRIAAGGDVLAPGSPDEPVQLVDVRDLADWIVVAAAGRLSGTYDGIGPPVPRRQFLDALAAGLGTAPDYTWVPQDYLLEQGVRPWDGERSLPLWLPVPQYGGFLARDVSASLAAGLACRPLRDTARDTWRWLDDNHPQPCTAGLAPADEADLLRRWRQRRRAPSL